MQVRSRTSSSILECWLPAQVRDPRGCPGLWVGFGRGLPVLGEGILPCLVLAAMFLKWGPVFSWFLTVTHLFLRFGVLAGVSIQALGKSFVLFPQFPCLQLSSCPT